MANYNTLIEKHSASAALRNPQSPPTPPREASYRFPLDLVQASNTQLTNARFSHESITMQDFQTLCPSAVQLFSDGVYRLVKENNGVVSHIPALVSGN